MKVSGTVRWFGLALLGILIAAGVAFAASRLASQQIGLASEPISAGDALAPRAKATGRPGHGRPGKRPRHSAPATTPSVTTPPATTPAPPHPTPIPETIAPEPQPEVPSHAGVGAGEHRGGGHADD